MRRHARSRRRLFARAGLIATGFLLTSSGLAYAYFSATGSGTYGVARAGMLTAPVLSIASHSSSAVGDDNGNASGGEIETNMNQPNRSTPGSQGNGKNGDDGGEDGAGTGTTTLTLTWAKPSNPLGTTWVMKETGSTGSGTCFTTVPPSPTCTVNGLNASGVYNFQLTYTLFSWQKTSNVVAYPSSSPQKACGDVKETSLVGGSSLAFTLVGGGGGRGGSSGGEGAPGAAVHGMLRNTNANAVTVIYEAGCAGTPGARHTGGGGGAGYAAGGKGGDAHTAIGGGGGGGGGATYLALKFGSAPTVVAVVGGGGGGGGSKTPSSHPGQPGSSTSSFGASTAPMKGLAGREPADDRSGGMGTGGGGGGAGTQALSGGIATSKKSTQTPGTTAGRGGQGGYNFVRVGTVTGVEVSVTPVVAGANAGTTGDVVLAGAPSA